MIARQVYKIKDKGKGNIWTDTDLFLLVDESGFYPSIVDPTSSENIAAGFYLGLEWRNTITGNKFYQKTDGVWISLGSISGVTSVNGQTGPIVDLTADMMYYAAAF